MKESRWYKSLNAAGSEGSVMIQNGGFKTVQVTISMQTQQPWGLWVLKLGRVCHARVRWARLSLPLSVRAELQWRWGRWRGHGRGRCRGLLGRGLRERRHRKTSADSETKSSPGRQPLGTPLDGRMPLQVGGDGRSGDRQPDSSGGNGACTRTHTLLRYTQSCCYSNMRWYNHIHSSCD